MRRLKKLYKIVDRKRNRVISENALTPDEIQSQRFEVEYDYGKIKNILTKKYLSNFLPSIRKYEPLLPIVSHSEIPTLYEGNTPLYKSKFIGKKIKMKALYFKNEGFNPTGSFKDRGSIIEVYKAKVNNAKGVVVASTGNMAASISAYCAFFKIPCIVVIPEKTPTPKLSQILFYGSRVLKVRGDYDYAVTIAIEIAKQFKLFLAGDYSFRLEGQKTQAYEIITQLDFNVPDYVFVPAGNGTNISAIWKGFKEFYQMELVNKLPKMVAVQVNAYDTVVREFNKSYKKRRGKQELAQPTAASAVAVKNPLDIDKVITLLKESKGIALSVNEDDIIEARKELARNYSLFVEPSSALTYAALKKLIEKKKIDKNSSIVCLLTGTGLKDTMTGLEDLSTNITFAENFTSILEILRKQNGQQ